MPGAADEANRPYVGSGSLFGHRSPRLTDRNESIKKTPPTRPTGA